MVREATKLSGLKDIKTMCSSKKKIAPRVQNSTYLDLYVLHREKDRLKKEAAALDKRKNGILKRLGEINVEMDELRKAEAGRTQRDIEGSERSSDREWKTMPLKY
jgi:hypothetical protein